MDNKIEVFKNEQFGEIRTALIENEPRFVAVDVCRALEISNSSQAISPVSYTHLRILPLRVCGPISAIRKTSGGKM